MHRLYFFYSFPLLLFITGCASVPPIDNGCVSGIVRDRINNQVQWYQGFEPNDEIKKFIQCSIEKEMSVDAVIQVALLNNPQIQSIFEELGIAQASLVEAGLLSNPSFEIEIRYPHRVGLKTNIEYLITSSLLDIFLIPLRTKLAATEFEQTKLKVANAILSLAFEVRENYYELLAEKQKIVYIESVVGLLRINSEIVSKQARMGNVINLDFQLDQSRLLEAELQLGQARVFSIGLQERLNKLLGLKTDMCLRFSDNLFKEINDQEFDLCALESTALNNRLDLQVARFEVIRLSQMLGIKEWWTYSNLQGGVSGERDTDGTNLIGPGFSAQLPIFNYGQAARLKLLAQLRQAHNHIATLEIQILSEVREAYKFSMSYLEIINDYCKHLLPLQTNILTSSEALYNVMGLGIDQLLENKRRAITVQQDYLEIVKNYLIARVKLDRALGGYLSLCLSHSPDIEEIEK